MMWLKVIFVSLNMFSMIGQIFSSTHVTFGKAPNFLDHYREKENSVYRGLLLSYRAYDINYLCQMIYGSQFYLIDNMNEDDQYFYGRPNYMEPMSNYTPGYRDFWESNLEVGKMGHVIGDTWKLYIKCNARFIKHRKPRDNLVHDYLYVSFAFKPMWFVIEIQDEKNPHHFFSSHYAVVAPDLITYEPAEVEEDFVIIHRNIEMLKKESPTYMEYVEGRDPLSNLSEKQKLLLCASILSSKVFHRKKLEFSLDWMNEIVEKKTDESLDHTIKVSLKTTSYAELPPVRCILCKAVEDVTKNDSKRTNVYVTRSYRKSYSAFALIESDDGVYLHSEFKNIPILMPGHEDMNVGDFILNFNLDQPIVPI